MSNSIITHSFIFTRRSYIFFALILFLIGTPTFTYGKRRAQPSICTDKTPLIRRPDLRPFGQIVEHNVNSITFVASMKSPELFTNNNDWRSWSSSLNHVVQLSSEFEPGLHPLLEGSEMPASIQPSKGFVHSIVAAYKDHHNLILTPDDIWIAILVQFSLYVNANEEELRHHFVTHNGTKQLDISVDSEDFSINKINWTEAFKNLESILESNTNKKMSQFVTNNFTTTTEATRIASTLVFMSTLQKYFTYNFSIFCGIPRMTILGTVGDWEEIAKRVEFLKTFGPIPTQWSEMLSPIIEQFINAKQGKIDAEFWGNMVTIRDRRTCGGSSKIYLDGWITTFARFDKKGEVHGERSQLSLQKWPTLDMSNVASGVVSVPIKINSVRNATIVVGHMGYGVSDDKTTLSPYVGWAVATIDPTEYVSEESEEIPVTKQPGIPVNPAVVGQSGKSSIKLEDDEHDDDSKYAGNFGVLHKIPVILLQW